MAYAYQIYSNMYVKFKRIFLIVLPSSIVSVSDRVVEGSSAQVANLLLSLQLSWSLFNPRGKMTFLLPVTH